MSSGTTCIKHDSRVDSNTKEPLDLLKMNPFPKRLFLKRLSPPELIRWANISKNYENWIRSYLAETRVLTIKPCNNKICLSRNPCSISNFKCSHRIIRSISTIKNMIDLNMLQVDTICIQVPMKPKNVKSGIHMVKKLCRLFKSGIYRVIVDVSKEEPYVEEIEKLLLANDKTLESFMVRNLDVDQSKFNFPHFLSRTNWNIKDFPMRKGQLKNHRQRRAKKRISAQNRLHRVNGNRLVNFFGQLR